MDYIPYGKQHIDQDDIDAVIQVLKSEFLTQGPKVKEFEEMMAAYHNCRYAVAFSSGTAALHGAYYTSTKFPFGKHEKIITDQNILYKKPSLEEYEAFKNEYWEFITSPITFVASVNGGVYCGGTPKLVDVDLNTYCIDIDKIEDEITEDTRVITPVSYGGFPVDIKAIRDLPKVKNNNICIIHDACHAIGARRNGHEITDFADMTILSFHPVKHITTGEGGMVLTNSKDYYEALLSFRSHGITKDPNKFYNQSDGDWYYEMQSLGYNYRITDFQCALGISQLNKLDKFLYKRNQLAKIYEDNLKNYDWINIPPGFSKNWLKDEDFINLNKRPQNLHSYHLFSIKLDARINRKEFFDYMRGKGVGVQIHYIPTSRTPFYNSHIGANLENSNLLYNSIITLPLFYDYSLHQLEDVLQIINDYRA